MIIELTLEGGLPIWINSEHIVCIENHNGAKFKGYPKAVVYMTTRTINVMETPHQILSLIPGWIMLIGVDAKAQWKENNVWVNKPTFW